MRQNEKLSALGLLAAEVAHEIRNPLTVMKLLYHSLDLKFDAQDPRAKDAQIIEAKIEHLNKIVEQILDFARTTEPKFAPVNLNELGGRIKPARAAQAGEPGHPAGARFAIRFAAGAGRRAATGAGVSESDSQRRRGDARAAARLTIKPGRCKRRAGGGGIQGHRRRHDAGAAAARVQDRAGDHEGQGHRPRPGHRRAHHRDASRRNPDPARASAAAPPCASRCRRSSYLPHNLRPRMGGFTALSW